MLLKQKAMKQLVLTSYYVRLKSQFVKSLTTLVLEGSVIVERLKSEEVGIGFNAATGEWVNMVEAGIVDPTKVTRSALQNAASVAAMFLTTEAVVADKPEESRRWRQCLTWAAWVEWAA